MRGNPVKKETKLNYTFIPRSGSAVHIDHSDSDAYFNLMNALSNIHDEREAMEIVVKCHGETHILERIKI